MQNHCLSRQGFTLVELSIVLVIIGLLIGGILVGQSLVESAKINAQVKQFQQYDIAVSQFKTKFKKLPGDAPAFGGNGNGKLEGLPPGLCKDVRYGECVLFYTSLGSTGFIPNFASSASAPATKAPSGLNWYLDGTSTYRTIPQSTINTRASLFITGAADGGLFLVISQLSAWANNLPAGLRPVDSLALDKKMDDGIPSSGSVVPVCQPGNTAPANYAVALQTSGACSSACLSGANYGSSNSISCTLAVKLDSSVSN